jgi:nucleoside-diphosphate-sugar epimerase
MKSHLFIFGLGYSGLALARDLAGLAGGEDWQISGTCRGSGRCRELAEEGVTALPFDGSHGSIEIEKALAEADHILACIPPEREGGGDPVLTHFSEILARSRRLKWLGYLSTTGVYGNRDGGWVDETSPLQPTSPRATRRVAAEAAWTALAGQAGLPLHIFRLAGIYGPGRNSIRNLLEGKARRVIKRDHVFSRIHLADLVNVLKASMSKPNTPPEPVAVYNLADDLAADPAEVVAYAASLLGVAPPEAVDYAEAGLSEMAKSFYADCKRVANQRIKDELGLRLLYPTYREGLEALLANELESEQSVED